MGKARTQTAAERYAQSQASQERARGLMPGGVSSPVRAFNAVGRGPVVIREGHGCRVTDLDGNSYIDYVCSYGPLVAGHAPPSVVAAITKAASRGASFGMPSELESRLAADVVDAVPGVELVRFVNSGTEATMSAIRLARAATGRSKLIKCIGGYHGHADALLVQAGSGATTLGTPSSPGVPPGATADTLLMPYNDLQAAAALFEQHEGQVACVIVEPVAGNMGCIPPSNRYPQGLRELCDAHGAMLIFDEVMTGFRVAYGGAQALYGVRPDLTCLGKIVGGGLPCGAYGGPEPVMRRVSPDGPVYQAGTLSGNPVAMAAGQATLELLREPGAYRQLERASAALADGLLDAAGRAGVPVRVSRVGSMLTPFFSAEPVTDYEGAKACDTAAFARFFDAMLDAGVTLPPSQYEAWFVSLAHDDEAIEQTLAAAGVAFEAAGRG